MNEKEGVNWITYMYTKIPFEIKMFQHFCAHYCFCDSVKIADDRKIGNIQSCTYYLKWHCQRLNVFLRAMIFFQLLL